MSCIDIQPSCTVWIIDNDQRTRLDLVAPRHTSFRSQRCHTICANCRLGRNPPAYLIGNSQCRTGDRAKLRVREIGGGANREQGDFKRALILEAEGVPSLTCSTATHTAGTQIGRRLSTGWFQPWAVPVHSPCPFRTSPSRPSPPQSHPISLAEF